MIHKTYSDPKIVKNLLSALKAAEIQVDAQVCGTLDAKDEELIFAGSGVKLLGFRGEWARVEADDKSVLAKPRPGDEWVIRITIRNG